MPRVLELTHPQSVARLRDLWDELERLRIRDEDESGPGLTAEDETRFTEMTAEYQQVDDHRRSLERRADMAAISTARAELRTVAEDSLRRGMTERGIPGPAAIGRADYSNDPLSNPDSIPEHRFRNPWDLSEMRTFDRDKDEVSGELRSRALGAIERMPGASDVVRQAATKIVEEFDDADARISRMVLATSSPEYMRAWGKAMRGKPMTSEESGILSRAMSLTDAAGGYLVPFQLDPTVIITANGSQNDIRTAARNVVATGDVWHGVSSGAASWSWDTEGSQVSDDATTFGQPEVPVYKASGFIPISIEAASDEANVAQEVARVLAFGKDVLEAAAFTTGTGSDQPTGLITALVASAGGASLVTPTTAETFAGADIYKMDAALPARFRRNASWLANRSIYNLVRQFDTAGGAALWERIGADLPPLLMGRRALEAEDMDGAFDAAATANNYLLAYGDMQHYVIADRIGFTVEPIPHLFGANGRPTGQRGWYAYYRVGADSVLDAAFRLLNIATTA